MAKSTKTEKQAPLKIFSGKVDENSIVFNWNSENAPSEEIQILLDTIDFTWMQLSVDLKAPASLKPDDVYSIKSVNIKGSPSHVHFVLQKIHLEIVKELDAYTGSDEATVTKQFEFAKCKYLIRKFYYETNLNHPQWTDIKEKYDVHFLDEKWARIPSTNISTVEVEKEVISHRLVRKEFLDVIYQNFELQIDKLKIEVSWNELYPFPQNKKKEKELLEVWLALKETGFIQFLDGIKDRGRVEAKLRDDFFAIFQLPCRDYTHAHAAQAERKEKNTFLKELVRVMENFYIKK